MWRKLCGGSNLKNSTRRLIDSQTGALALFQSDKQNDTNLLSSMRQTLNVHPTTVDHLPSTHASACCYEQLTAPKARNKRDVYTASEPLTIIMDF